MNLIMKPISEIIPYDNNPRDNDGAVEAVAESIQSYGWQQPIVLDTEGVILAGHTRYKAAQSLGLAEVPCVVAENLSPEQARAYRLADNKTSDFSLWDNKKLLQELDEIGFDLFTGFTEGDLFEDLLDEKDNAALVENEAGVIYEISFRSEQSEKIEKVKTYWDTLGGNDARE